jgi:hypothetical protein
MYSFIDLLTLSWLISFTSVNLPLPMTSMLRRQIHTVSRIGRRGYSTVAPRAFSDEKGITISWPDNRQTRLSVTINQTPLTV